MGAVPLSLMETINITASQLSFFFKKQVSQKFARV